MADTPENPNAARDEAASNAAKQRKAKRRVRATPQCSDKVWDIVDGQLVERKKWAEYEEAHRARTIRKMALAIIRITAELNECTDAALRNCGEFDALQIRAYGEQACSDANDIAGRGPFSIVVNGGANGQPSPPETAVSP